MCSGPHLTSHITNVNISNHTYGANYFIPESVADD